MTVHGAKGLQAPIVFLPDTLQAPSQTPRLLWTADGLAALGRRAAICDAPAAERGARRPRCDRPRRGVSPPALRRDDARRGPPLSSAAGRRAEPRPTDCWYNLVAAGLATDRGAARLRFRARSPAMTAGTAPACGSSRRRRSRRSDDDALAARRCASTAALPDWARRHAAARADAAAAARPVAAEPRRAGDALAARPRRRRRVSAGFKRGLIVHRLLQILPDLPRSGAAGRRRALPRAPGPRPRRARSRARSPPRSWRCSSIPTSPPLFGPESQAEVPIVGLIGDYALSGQIDRLLVGDARDPDRRLQDAAAAAGDRGRGAAGLSAPARRLPRRGPDDLSRARRALRAAMDRRASAHDGQFKGARRMASIPRLREPTTLTPLSRVT